MNKLSREIAGFTVLPVLFPLAKAFPQAAKHYLYLKRHEPNEADEDAERSLFIANLPVATTDLHLKHLFQAQLDGGIIERVEFSDRTPLDRSTTPTQRKTGKKRKRITADDLEQRLEAYQLPSTWNGVLKPLGSQAVAVFVDRASMDVSLKAAKRVNKLGAEIVWGQGLEEKIQPQGLQRFKSHHAAQYPSRNELVNLVDDFMSSFNQMIELKSRELAKKRQLPDEDGFITVTKGSKAMARKQDPVEMKKESEKGLEDFYKFQNRGKMREQREEIVKRFDEDKQRVEELKRRRGKLRASSVH